MHGAGRVVGLDLGARRIGVAVSDASRSLASPRTVFERSGDPAADLAALAALVVSEEATCVVVGLPRSLSGALGPAARRVLEEVEQLRGALGVPVDTVDERLTTTEALRRRRGRAEEATGRRATGRGAPRRYGPAPGRAVIDHEAAAILLQAWLDAAATDRS